MHKSSQLYRPTNIKSIRHRCGGWTKTSVRNRTDEATIYRGMKRNAPHCIRYGHVKSGAARSLDKSNISWWACHLPGPVRIYTCRGIVPIIAQAVVQAMLVHQRMLPTGPSLGYNLWTGIACKGQGGMATGHYIAKGCAPFQSDVGIAGRFRNRHMAHVAHLDTDRSSPIPRRTGTFPIHRIHPPRESKGGVGPVQ